MDSKHDPPSMAIILKGGLLAYGEMSILGPATVELLRLTLIRRT